MIELVQELALWSQLIASSVFRVPFHPDPLPSSSCWLHAFGWIVVASAFQTNHYSQTSKQDLFAKQMLLFFTLLRNCPTKSPMASYGFISLKASFLKSARRETHHHCWRYISRSAHFFRSRKRRCPVMRCCFKRSVLDCLVAFVVMAFDV